MHPLIFTKDQLQIQSTVWFSVSLTYDYESSAIPFWKQSNLRSLYLRVVLLCSLKHFTEVDFFASASQNASD